MQLHHNLNSGMLLPGEPGRAPWPHKNARGSSGKSGTLATCSRLDTPGSGCLLHGHCAPRALHFRFPGSHTLPSTAPTSLKRLNSTGSVRSSRAPGGQIWTVPDARPVVNHEVCSAACTFSLWWVRCAAAGACGGRVGGMAAHALVLELGGYPPAVPRALSGPFFLIFFSVHRRRRRRRRRKKRERTEKEGEGGGCVSQLHRLGCL